MDCFKEIFVLLKELSWWLIWMTVLYWLQFLGNLRNLRDSHAALAVGSSETIAGEPSSVTRIISECESALTFLNRDLGILSASIAREQGEEVNLRWNCCTSSVDKMQSLFLFFGDIWKMYYFLYYEWCLECWYWLHYSNSF